MQAVSSHRVRRFVAKWDLPFAIFTVALYGLIIPLTIVSFPNVSTMTQTILILLTGFTASVSALATLLKEREPND